MSLHYLIDGFNVLYAMEPLPEGTWETKRQILLNHLRAERFHGRNRLTVIFDSKQGLGDRQEEGDMTVVYTAGETADDWISRKVRDSANPRVLVIVTNDQGLKQQVKGTGAKVISADDFLRAGSVSPERPRREAPSNSDQITAELMKKWLK